MPETDLPPAAAPHDLVLRAETPADHAAVRTLISAAFEDEHVAVLADALRLAPAPLAPQAFVAEADGRIIGHVMLSASRLDAPRQLVDVLVLSPLSVLPEYQGRAIGTRLVRRALEAADARGVPLLFLEGSPRYYGARGFARADTLGFRSPSLRIPEPAFQVARLAAYQPWMTGTLVYAETFWALDCVGLRENAQVGEIE
ncbi:N-acetyltransferase [Actinospica durhamensis]|uniref:N-acetyltransferase n=1 Tax=Actinospica durhamensis TaxID=1508375 RepID=A0A941IWD0_9ACTN|nr:N-acetyltransferase [Actinospica durhamensis]MBR7839081.1 N-acetyltransferase [Actinospica durhamensis]